MSSNLRDRVFIFCLAFLGYNTIKYYPFSKIIMSNARVYRMILPCGVFGLLFSLYTFFSLSVKAQLLLFICSSQSIWVKDFYCCNVLDFIDSGLSFDRYWGVEWNALSFFLRAFYPCFYCYSSI